MEYLDQANERERINIKRAFRVAEIRGEVGDGWDWSFDLYKGIDDQHRRWTFIGYTGSVLWGECWCYAFAPIGKVNAA